MNAVNANLDAVPRDAVAGSQVIYEVTLDIERRAAKRFDVWLKGHMREMCGLPGFLGAELTPADRVATESDPRSVRRVVRYRLANRAALDAYLDQHAARMRTEGLRYFGRQLHSSRRLLAADGQLLVEGEELAPATLRCLNCNSVLTGKYCIECGQPNHNYAAPLWGIIEDFFGNHFGFDTKLFRSAVPLLFRPGFLSREYSAGRRVRYIAPLRLYLFCSLLFFFVAWSVAPRQFFQFNGQRPEAATSAPAASRSLSAAEQQEIRNTPYLSAQQKREILDAAAGATHAGQAAGAAARATKDAGSTAAASGADNGNLKFSIFGMRINMPKAEFEARITTALEHDLPKLMFVFLPLVALLLKLFYLRSRRYYMEHLVFTLHNHAFVFATMLAMLLAGLLARHAAWAAAPAHYFNVIVGWYIVVYVFLAMLLYYRQSFLKTLGKYLLVGGIYWICLFSVFMLGLVLVFASVVA